MNATNPSSLSGRPNAANSSDVPRGAVPRRVQTRITAGVALAARMSGCAAVWFALACLAELLVQAAITRTGWVRADHRWCPAKRRMRALATALDHAEFLHEQCSPKMAARALRPALKRYDPATECADRLVIRAAVVFASTAFSTPESQLAYALFAERNSRSGYGLADPLTLSAMTTLVAVAVYQDLHVEAITVCGRLIQAYTERGEHADALTWRRERAALLHGDGQCDQALDEALACMDLAAVLPGADRQTAARRAMICCAVIVAGCLGPTAALIFLGKHRDLLPPEGSKDRRAEEATIAGAIHGVEATHPAVCTQARDHEHRPDRSLAFWTAAVGEAARR